MDTAPSSNLVFETLQGLRLLVSYQTAANPTDVEWDDWMAAADSLAENSDDIRLLIITEGGHPTKQQINRLRSTRRDVSPAAAPLTAIVSPSPTLRFVASMVSFFNRTIHCFSPAERESAFAHIGLTKDEGLVVDDVIDRLRRRI